MSAYRGCVMPRSLMVVAAHSIRLVALVLAGLMLSQNCYAEAQIPSHLARVVTSLGKGDTTVRVVCFGDSITGVYYHTGGRRAWCDMLGIALGKIYPKARIQMINAGISGNTTAQGLVRMQRDVLAHKPQLVVVMYGMNDVVRTEAERFESNLRTIVDRCRSSDAAIVLCTPNSVYSNEPRPMVELAAFAQIVRNVAKDMSVCLADCFSVYEEIRQKDVTRWSLLMSETIHPGMNGHKLFAEVMAKSISGQRVSLEDEAPPADALQFTLKRLSQKLPLDVVAMPPFDKLVPDALRGQFPDAEFRITTWPTEGQSLAEIEQWSRGIRKKKPHLVVVAVPGDRESKDEETYIRTYSWILNWSVDFGKSHWDLMPILPSVTGELTAEQHEREGLARQIFMGMDTRWVERRQGDKGPAIKTVSDWIAEQR